MTCSSLPQTNEKTEVIYGSENTINKAFEFLSESKETFDNCIDYAGPSALVETKVMWEAVVKLKSRDVKIRSITEITRGNISYCKQIMQIAELRHLKENKNDYNNKTEVIVKIKDTGIGISSEMMPRLFTKFATTSEKGGTGLGCLYPKVL